MTYDVIIPKMRDTSGQSEITEKRRNKGKFRRLETMQAITMYLKFFILKAYTEQRDKHKNPVKKKKKKTLKKAITLEEVQDGHM